MLNDCPVILLRVLPAEVGPEIRVPGVLLVKIVWDISGTFIVVGAMNCAVRLLENGVAIRKPVLTCITCRLSAASRCPSRQQGSGVR